MKTFEERLVFYMNKRGFNQKSLALAAGLNETAVRDILASKSKSPKTDTMLALCRTLEVYPHELVPAFRELYPEDALPLLDQLTEIMEEKLATKKKIEALKASAKKS